MQIGNAVDVACQNASLGRIAVGHGVNKGGTAQLVDADQQQRVGKSFVIVRPRSDFAVARIDYEGGDGVVGSRFRIAYHHSHVVVDKATAHVGVVVLQCGCWHVCLVGQLFETRFVNRVHRVPIRRVDVPKGVAVVYAVPHHFELFERRVVRSRVRVQQFVGMIATRYAGHDYNNRYYDDVERFHAFGLSAFLFVLAYGKCESALQGECGVVARIGSHECLVALGAEQAVVAAGLDVKHHAFVDVYCDADIACYTRVDAAVDGVVYLAHLVESVNRLLAARGVADGNGLTLASAGQPTARISAETHITAQFFAAKREIEHHRQVQIVVSGVGVDVAVGVGAIHLVVFLHIHHINAQGKPLRNAQFHRHTDGQTAAPFVAHIVGVVCLDGVGVVVVAAHKTHIPFGGR